MKSERKGGRQFGKFHKLTGRGVILLGIMIFLAVIVPLSSPFNITAQNPDLRNAGSSFVHLFGTDKFGRDIFVRVWSGTRISLLVGVGSAVIIGITGVLAGCVAGYAQGIVDMLVMRLGDILDAIPSLLYVILIMLVRGANVGSILLGISISGWVELARIVRGEVIRIKAREFCIASRLVGAGPARMFWRHLLPNAVGPIIANLTFTVPKAIFMEAFLSFVGVGISAPQVSLGTMIQEAQTQMQIYPTQMLYPIIVLCGLILALNLIGAGLEKSIDR